MESDTNVTSPYAHHPRMAYRTSSVNGVNRVDITSEHRHDGDRARHSRQPVPASATTRDRPRASVCASVCLSVWPHRTLPGRPSQVSIRRRRPTSATTTTAAAAAAAAVIAGATYHRCPANTERRTDSTSRVASAQLGKPLYIYYANS